MTGANKVAQTIGAMLVRALARAARRADEEAEVWPTAGREQGRIQQRAKAYREMASALRDEVAEIK